MRQGPHLIRHHGKTTPGIPGPGRFDRGIESQQIGLLGNGTDHIQHFGYTVHLLRQLPNLLGIGGHTGRQRLDRNHGQTHLLPALAGNTV
ncbi:hypothetical protein D9M71_363710 [compost metagenome]